MDNPTDSTAIANATRAAALHGIYNRQVETLDRLAATEQAKAQAAREARDRVMAQNAAYLTGGKL